MGQKTFVAAVMLVILLGGAFLTKMHLVGRTRIPTAPQVPSQTGPEVKNKLINTVVYSCDYKRTITAGYFEGSAQATTTPGEPPIPTGGVSLIFGDRPPMTLQQTLSADGGRYANADESFVFWSKGNGALILQDGSEKEYKKCVANNVALPDTTTIPAGTSTK